MLRSGLQRRILKNSLFAAPRGLDLIRRAYGDRDKTMQSSEIRSREAAAVRRQSFILTPGTPPGCVVLGEHFLYHNTKKNTKKKF